MLFDSIKHAGGPYGEKVSFRESIKKKAPILGRV